MQEANLNKPNPKYLGAPRVGLSNVQALTEGKVLCYKYPHGNDEYVLYRFHAGELQARYIGGQWGRMSRPENVAFFLTKEFREYNTPVIPLTFHEFMEQVVNTRKKYYCDSNPTERVTYRDGELCTIRMDSKEGMAPAAYLTPVKLSYTQISAAWFEAIED